MSELYCRGARERAIPVWRDRGIGEEAEEGDGDDEEGEGEEEEEEGEEDGDASVDEEDDEAEEDDDEDPPSCGSAESNCTMDCGTDLN